MSESIDTPCPSCGGRSLVVGGGGYLVCGYLECKAPTLADDVLRKYDELRRRKSLIDGESRAIELALAHFSPQEVSPLASRDDRVREGYVLAHEAGGHAKYGYIEGCPLCTSAAPREEQA